MIIRNADIFTSDYRFCPGSIFIQDGRIERVLTAEKEPGYPAKTGEGEKEPGYPAEAGEGKKEPGYAAEAEEGDKDFGPVIDASGCYAIPGLIDIHFHGCMGKDFCDGTQEAIRTLAEYELSQGITAICPATLTLPVEQLCHVLSEGAAFAQKQREWKKLKKGDAGFDGCADLVGVNMEGPFISRIKKGAQNEKYIIGCDADICEQFIRAGKGLLKIIGLAPEENPSFEAYIKSVKDKVRVSLAHTNADYDTAMAAFEAGASHAVHLFNAMPEFTHRQPGVVGAVQDSPQVTAELICDGNHVHPSAVRAAFSMIGPERMVLISDSLRAAGLGEGIIDLGGQEVRVSGTRATLVKGGNLAGSVTNLMECMRICVREMGIPLEDAVRCASINPARVISEDKERGSLERGKIADVLLLNKKDLKLKAVIKDGKRLNA